jgi:hypothetical protein
VRLGASCGIEAHQGKGSGSFLKKRTKKLFYGCRGLAGGSRAKVFASFFKKKRLLAARYVRVKVSGQYG